MIIPKTKTSWILIVSYLGFAMICDKIANSIYPGFSDSYGSHASIGYYYFMPIFWIIYGVIIYLLGLKLNFKKELIESSIISDPQSYKKVKDTKYYFFFIPMQYIGLLFFAVGVIALLIQIIYRALYL
jgi:uncharacterized membrane protein YedE/YeeE